MKSSEQVTANSERRGRLIVLPSVWAVAEKKPCGSESSMLQARAFGTRNANAEVSPLRSFAAPVEMTNVKKIGLAPSVEMTTLEKEETGAGHKLQISPLRGDAAPVEMTAVEGTSAAALGEPASVTAANSAVVTRTADVGAGGVALEVAFYRKYTEAMLRRYAVISMEAGRVPSMLGREMFRGKVTSYRVRGFDDAVIFCHDVESCLKRLSVEEQRIIKRIAVQQYTHGEAALMFGVCLRTCVTLYNNAIDKMTRRLLEARLLEPQKLVNS